MPHTCICLWAILGVDDTTLPQAIVKRTRYAMSKHDVAAHVDDGGWAFPDPGLTLQAMQVRVLLAAMRPVRANAPPNPGSWWMTTGIHWILDTIGGHVSLGAAGILHISDWQAVVHRLTARHVPHRIFFLSP